MKSKLTLFAILLIFSLVSIVPIYAQSMGISSEEITPDTSSILEMRTTEKGILIPRMNTSERNAISDPANGLMVYNNSTNQYNFYNGDAWVVWGSAAYLSVEAGDTITTNSTTDIIVSEMTKTATESGSYVVHFNSQVTIPDAVYTTGFSSQDAANDLDDIYFQLIGFDPTLTTGAAKIYANGDIISPGIFAYGGAVSVSVESTITFDGKDDEDSLFIIRAAGAFNTGAGVRVVLINKAKAENIFFIAEGAIGFGVRNRLEGNYISKGAAIAVGTTCTLNGRLLTRGGAISFGKGTLSVPETIGVIDFKTLTNFMMFTNSGGVSNAGDSTYNGDIGTNLGAITGFADATVNGEIFSAGSTTLITPVNHMAIFGLYKNGELIPFSSRTRSNFYNPSDISLQGFSAINKGDVIDVRWRMVDQEADTKEIKVHNRILTVVKVGI